MQTTAELLPASPEPGHYTIDPASSRIGVRTRHLFGLAPVRGTFGLRSGSVDIADPVQDTAIRAEIDAASFRSGNSDRDGNVRSARLLDAARSPLITFGNARVSAGDATIAGELTVRGVSRPVTLALTAIAAAGSSFTATATVRVDRTEFGVTGYAGLAGRYLDLTIEVRCVRGGNHRG
jgi:polyisoprenoid-binding protein YceI